MKFVGITDEERELISRLWTKFSTLHTADYELHFTREARFAVKNQVH